MGVVVFELFSSWIKFVNTLNHKLRKCPEKGHLCNFLLPQALTYPVPCSIQMDRQTEAGSASFQLKWKHAKNDLMLKKPQQ